MARTIETEKGYKLVKLDKEELDYLHEELGFGNVCDKCNEPIVEREFYYIPVLNSIYCEKCLTDFLSYISYYPEDTKYENRRLENIKTVLGIYYEE